MTEGQAMHDFARTLFPICRSLTGPGVRATLAEIKRHLPEMTLHEVPSGTKAFDWTVPDEWAIRGARLFGPDGNKVVDFADHNLHVVGYSEPVDLEIPLDALQAHLHSLPDQPDAIPYITSYYSRRWGFCLSHRQRETLKAGTYRAVIDSTLAPGSLTYGELILPGETDREIFLSTYVCHPSMANNELSGPAVATWLGKWLRETKRRHTVRMVFIPETIGSIVYLSRNIEIMKRRIAAGFNITCVGDERHYSYLPSRTGGTLADRAALAALGELAPDFVRYSFLDRGSDERQYCAPGVDLPVCSVMRTRYGDYPEYHTSLDDLTLVTPAGLQGTYDVLKRAIELIEANRTYRVTVLCEPQLGKRGLYSTLSTKSQAEETRTMMNVIAYADGTRDLLSLAQTIGEPPMECARIAETMRAHGLMELLD